MSLACSQLRLHTDWGLRQESRLAMDSGKSLGKLSLWAGLSGCRLTSAEAAGVVEEASSRSARGLTAHSTES